MKVRVNGLILMAGVCLNSGLGFSFDFSNADSAFLTRGRATATNRTPIHEAINLYKQSFSQGLDQVDTMYAAEQIARLYAYETQFPISNAAIISASEGCMATLGRIDPAKVGENPAYYYWSALCRMAWAKATGIIQSLEYAEEIVGHIESGLSLDPSYEGGGFDRLGGVVFSKLPTFNPFGPSQDLPRAFDHFRDSMGSDFPYDDPKHPSWMNPDKEIGEYFYSTYFYYAEALVTNEDYDTACTVIYDATSRIDEGKIGHGREADMLLARTKLSELYTELGCQ